MLQVAMAVFVVACGVEFFRQAGDTLYPAVEVLQGGSRFASGAIEGCQFCLVISADGECFFFFLHYFFYYGYLLFSDIKIVIKCLIIK